MHIHAVSPVTATHDRAVAAAGRRTIAFWYCSGTLVGVSTVALLAMLKKHNIN